LADQWFMPQRQDALHFWLIGIKHLKLRNVYDTTVVCIYLFSRSEADRSSQMLYVCIQKLVVEAVTNSVTLAIRNVQAFLKTPYAHIKQRNTNRIDQTCTDTVLIRALRASANPHTRTHTQTVGREMLVTYSRYDSEDELTVNHQRRWRTDRQACVCRHSRPRVNAILFVPGLLQYTTATGVHHIESTVLESEDKRHRSQSRMYAAMTTLFCCYSGFTLAVPCGHQPTNQPGAVQWWMLVLSNRRRLLWIWC